MNMLKPTFEKIDPTFGSSFTVRVFNESNKNNPPFYHFHPELELIYVKGGSGKRHIGNHLSCYQNGELILMGAGLPHAGFTDRMTRNESEVVVQMRDDFLGNTFLHLPEMKSIQQLFDRAKLGISYFGETKKIVGRRLEKLAEMHQFERLLELLSILKLMAESEEYELLNAGEFAIEVKAQDNQRINEIYDFVQKNFKRPISLEEIATEVSMTVPAFCRYFKKQSNKTFTEFVNEFRVVHACKILTQESKSITEVAFDSGFNNFSHFNKLFKEKTGRTPSDYRSKFKQILM